LASIVILGKACDLIDSHQKSGKPATSSSPTKHPEKDKTSKKHSNCSDKSENQKNFENDFQILDNAPLEPSPPNKVFEHSSKLFEHSNKEFESSNNIIETPEELNESLKMSVGNNFVFFEGSVSTCPTFGGVERVDSISKSSSVILEEDDESRSVGTDSDGSDDNDDVITFAKPTR
jgi:hypothetical protein